MDSSDEDALPDLDNYACSENCTVAAVKKRNEFYSDSSDVEEVSVPNLAERLKRAESNGLNSQVVYNINSFMSSDTNRPSGKTVTNSKTYVANYTKPNSTAASSSYTDTYQSYSQEDDDMRWSNDMDCLPRTSNSYTSLKTTSPLDRDLCPNGVYAASEKSAVEPSENEIKVNSRTEAKAARDRQKEEKRLERERVKAEREKVKKEQEQEKTRKRMMQEAERTMKPGECLKYMTVVLDTHLLTQSCGTAVATYLQAMNVRYEVCEQVIHNSVTFWRASTIIKENESKKLENIQKDIIENEIVILVPLDEFIQMISAYHQINESSGVSLNTYITSVGSLLPPNQKLNLIVCGLEKYFSSSQSAGKGRANENKGKGKAANQSKACVTRKQVDECLLSVQLELGTAIDFVESDTDLAKLIYCYTKAIAETPFKRSRQQTDFDLYMDGTKSVKVSKEGQGLMQVWREQIMQFKNVNIEMANAIVSLYPSPRLLTMAYESCSSEKEAELLLQDIEVRRGAGVLSTVRRIGKELSRRVYHMLMNRDSNFIIKYH